MKIRDEQGVLVVILDSECTIAKAEAHTHQLRSLISDKTGRIEVRAGAAEEMDTAYFQMLLSLKATADTRKIPFEMPEASSEILRLCELYGVTLSPAQETA